MRCPSIAELQVKLHAALLKNKKGWLPKVKILNNKDGFTVKIQVSKCFVSDSAKIQIEKAGGSIEEVK